MVATAAPPAEKTIRGEGLKSAAQSGYGKAVLLTPEVTLANINDDSSSEHDEGSAGAETGESTARLCCVASADCAICTGSNARPATRMVLPELVAYEQVDAGCSMVVVGSHSSSTVLVYAMCNALPRSPLRVIAQLPLPPDRRTPARLPPEKRRPPPSPQASYLHPTVQRTSDCVVDIRPRFNRYPTI